MIQKNGYVQLEIKDKEAYIIYHPPISGGDNCDIKEVESYIIKQGFTSFSVQRINDLIENKEEKSLLLGESKYDFFSGTMDTETDEKWGHLTICYTEVNFMRKSVYLFCFIF